MKKIILMSITVLSVGLFSFTMPKTDGPSVWLLPDGNYSIDQGAMQNFTPADQQSVSQLLGAIYNMDMSQLTGPVDLEPIVDAATQGGHYASKYPWFWIFYSKVYRWDGASIASGSAEDQLTQIINQYAQPLQ